MAIAFCATTQALQECLAQLPPAGTYVTVVCSGEPLDLASLRECADQEFTAVVLDAPLMSLSYQTVIADAVSMLSKQEKSVILAPSIVANTVLAFPDLTPSAGGSPVRHVGNLSTLCDIRLLLQSAELRLLLLDGDVCAWFAPEREYLHLEGRGCAVVLSRLGLETRAAGNAPAAVQIDVLTPGKGRRW